MALEDPFSIKVEYLANGVLIHFLDENDEVVFYRMDRIATITKFRNFPYLIPKSKNMQKYMEKYRKLQKKYERDRISWDKYISQINEIRDKGIPINIPPDKNGKRELLKIGQFYKNEERLIQNLMDLVKKGIEIQLIPIKKSKFMVLLVERGPRISSDLDIEDIKNRPSHLDLYPNVKHLSKIVFLDEVGNIFPQPFKVHSSSQLVELATSTIDRIFDIFEEQMDNENTFSKEYKELDNYFEKRDEISTNYILSVPDLRTVDDLRIQITNYTRFKHYHLKNGCSIYLISSAFRFNEFLLTFAYGGLIDREMRIEFDQFKDRIYDRIIVFSERKIPGFVPVNIHDVRLNLLDLSSEENQAWFYSIIRAIDLIYGDPYLSVLSEFKDTMKNIREFDTQIINEIRQYSDFIDLLSQQLGNQSFLGDQKQIAKVYQILRQVQIQSIMNPVDSLRYDTSSTNILDLPKFVQLNINSMTSEDTILSFFLFICKYTQLAEEDVYNENITIVIDSTKVLYHLMDEKIQKIIYKLLDLNESIKLIYHGSNPQIKLDFVPTLHLSKKRDSSEVLEDSILELGEFYKFKVDHFSKYISTL